VTLGHLAGRRDASEIQLAGKRMTEGIIKTRVELVALVTITLSPRAGSGSQLRMLTVLHKQNMARASRDLIWRYTILDRFEHAQ